MSLTADLFQTLAAVAAVSLIVLTIGALMTWRLRQPIERIRAIQWTLAALVAALLIRQASLLPTLPIALWPVRSSVAPESDRVARTEPTDSPALRSDTLNETVRLTNDSALNATVRRHAPGADDDTSTVTAPVGSDSSSLAESLWGLFQIACITLAGLVGSWLVALLFIGRWQLQRLLRTAESATDELLCLWEQWPEAQQRDLQVLVSSRISVPMTFGVWRPAIVLPKTLVDPRRRRELVYCLSHEWEHVRRRDILTWWLFPAR